MEGLQKMIDQLVAEKSLSFEVLDQLKKVKEESEEAQDTIKNLELNINIQKTKNDELTKIVLEGEAKNAKLAEELEYYKGRDAQYVKSEHTLELKDKDVIAANNTLYEVKEIIGMVFKNPTVRKTVIGSIPVTMGGDRYVTEERTNTTETIDED